MRVHPIPPQAFSSFPGLDDVRKFYQVLKEPAPLAGMSFPETRPWKSLASLGFQSVVCLTHTSSPYDPDPLRILRAVKLKDLFGGHQPDDSKREANIVNEVVQAVVQELQAGRGVVVHCQGGTGRTGTVIGRTLVTMGMPPKEVLLYLTALNKLREKYPGWKGWPESRL